MPVESATAEAKKERVFLVSVFDAAAASAAADTTDIGGVRFTLIGLSLSLIFGPGVDEALEDVDDDDFLRSFMRPAPLVLGSTL